jgi:eukaryotic-like serine/threonine-protein kinase
MTEQSPAEAIFFTALEKGTAEERIAYLDVACGADENLRQRVERLLAAHPQVGNFLESPTASEIGAAVAPNPPPSEHAPEWSITADSESRSGQSEGVGSVIAGRYKLLETLGQGGMGTVFMAQQTEPVKRLVALKLIKLGMDSRQILARFGAERQALALMDHPNIAKVLDAGATDSGRPYFVMELVKGVPITRFCDERQLSPRDRLELLIQVCHAIQHAHQKGVIHRDIKPTNVLVCLYDDRPVPKVIDFGVAKAAGSQLTDASLVTGFGAIVGTPEYMSPEQDQLNQLDIDTRSDVYALGDLLYELLTGTTPIDRKRLGQGALLEMLRVIREEEPPRPSARLSSSEILASIAATRRTDPARLTRLVRGELDWIVMKCLEKERSRRYETANALARDLERYLHGDVVEARSPRAGYRLRKFIRKHRVAITTVSAFVGLMIAAAGTSAVLAIRARRAEREAIAAQTGLAEALQDSKLTAFSLQIDSDLAEFTSDRRVGILRLARTVKKSMIQPDDEMSLTDDRMSRRRALREFATMAVLASGQASAPLLQPITHNGAAVHSHFLTSSANRLVTLGDDRTARLWDPVTGRPIAILRGGDEQVIETGVSPAGATAFTHSPNGVVRLWETKDGAFRAKLEPTSDPVKSSNSGPVDPVESGFPSFSGILLSNDRVMTFESWHNQFGTKGSTRQRPCELWEAKTGQLIAQLDLPQVKYLEFQFVAGGRWILANDPFDSDQMLHLFSAENGHPIAKLKHGLQSRFDSFATNLSSDGRTAASGYHSEHGDPYYHINFWDTTSWKLTSVTEPRGYLFDNAPGIEFIADDLFATYESDTRYSGVSIYRPPAPFPISQFPDWTYLFRGEQVVLGSGQIFNTRTGARLHPPNGRKYHPQLTRFAPDGRFLPGGIDTLTEKAIPARGPYVAPKDVMGSYIDEPKSGWAAVDASYPRPEVRLYRLPTPNRLNIPPHVLELWAQVVARGHLDDQGAFCPSDEPTWEKNRQDLAAAPAPYPDFPFPGHLAVDRLYWLRQEYESDNNVDKPRLAQQLLDRANAVGDKAEAVRWIQVLASKLVDSLKTRPLLRADVLERLRQDVSLNSEIRAAALLKAAELEEDVQELNGASWPVAARPNAEQEEYRHALRWAEAAVRNQPENSAIVNTLGVLQYRNGLYREAVATLTRSHEAHRNKKTGPQPSDRMFFGAPGSSSAHRNSKTGPQPSDLAFLAMAHHALAESDKAREYLRQLTSLCEQPAWNANQEATGFLKEARQRLATPP